MNFSEIPWIAKHTELYRSDPEKAKMWDASEAGGQGQLETLLLTTIGRKSGEPRPSPLIFSEVDGAYAVVASKGGWPTHPHWYLNLVENPRCDLMVGVKQIAAQARVLTGEERARVWTIMCGIYPPYADYQKATEREIPVVMLEPVAAS